MPAPRKFSDETIQKILEDFHSDMSGVDVGKKYGCDYSKTIRKVWMSKFTKEDIDARFRRLCALHKTGDLNPMHKRCQEEHPRFNPEKLSVMGYRLVKAPDWYTGSVDKGCVAEHIAVACSTAGITQLPPSCIVHHKDENKLNNHPDNLEIMTRADHMREHALIRHKKKVQRLEQ